MSPGHSDIRSPIPLPATFRFCDRRLGAGLLGFSLAGLAAGCGEAAPTEDLVPAPAPTVALSLSTPQLLLGETLELGWTTTGATRCTASATPGAGAGGWGGEVAATGSGVRVIPEAPGTYVYAISCTGPGGSAGSSATARVTAPPAPAGTLIAGAPVGFVGEAVALTWQVSDAARCTADGAWNGSRPARGTELVLLDAPGARRYELTCHGLLEELRLETVIPTALRVPALREEFAPAARTWSSSEGAPYGDGQIWEQPELVHTRWGYGPTRVVRLYVCLNGFVEAGDCDMPPPQGPLSAGFVAALDAGLAAYQGSGLRLLIRFIYNFGPIGAPDAPLDIMLTHVDQVLPVLLRHRDLIFALEAGFIGTWGEWHDSSNDNDNPVARRALLDRLRAHVQGAFPLLLRMPLHLLQYAGTTVPSAELGLHDDYFLSDADDATTFAAGGGFSVQEIWNYAVATARASMFVAEFGALYPPRLTCGTLDWTARALRIQSVSLAIAPSAVGHHLEAEGCLQDFLSKVGTRIELREAALDGLAVPGGQLRVRFTLVNGGYGRVLRPRPAKLALEAGGTTLAEAPIPLETLDLRTLEPGAPPAAREVEVSFPLPLGLPEGPLSILLVLPDPGPSLAADPAHALPLNSLDAQGESVYDPLTGRNRLIRFLAYRAYGNLPASIPR